MVTLTPTQGPSSAIWEKWHGKKGLPSREKRAERLVHLKSGKKGRGEGHYRLAIPEWTCGADGENEQLDWLPEETEDHFNALAPQLDQLVQAKWWWALEFCPVEYVLWNSTVEKWQSKYGMNIGRPRPGFGSEPKMHWTVKYRMSNLAGYQYSAWTEGGSIWQVVA